MPEKQPAGFRPIVLGADALGYSYAREFAKHYSVRTKVLAPVAIKYTSSSRFTDYEVIPDIDSEESIVSWCEGHSGDFGGDVPLIIGGASDAHARTLSKHKGELEALGYAVPYTDFGVLDKVTQKDVFYGICESLGIPYPKTALFPINGADELHACPENAGLRRLGDADVDGLEYPVVVKPSNSAVWHYAKLRDRHKVYIVRSAGQMRDVLEDVRQSGYDRYLIVQEMLGEEDDSIYTLTLFCEDGECPIRVSGHVLVQDRSATGIGNPLTIMGEPHLDLLDAAERLLRSVGYEGYANFDVMRDSKTGELKFLEVNARPGRNTYYVSLAGCPFVKPIVRRFVEHGKASGLPAGDIPGSSDWIFTMLPPSVVLKEIEGTDAYDRAAALLKDGHWGNPLMNKDDCLIQRAWARINFEHMRAKFADGGEQSRHM